MQALCLDSKTTEEYLLKINNYVDELARVGVVVQHEEYVNSILKGLPSNYALVVSVIKSKRHMSSIAEIEAILYHETHLDRCVKETKFSGGIS